MFYIPDREIEADGKPVSELGYIGFEYLVGGAFEEQAVVGIEEKPLGSYLTQGQ